MLVCCIAPPLPPPTYITNYSMYIPNFSCLLVLLPSQCVFVFNIFGIAILVVVSHI